MTDLRTEESMEPLAHRPEVTAAESTSRRLPFFRGGGPLSSRRRLLTASLQGAVGVGILAAAGAQVASTTASDPDPQLREFTLTAEEIDWELQPGTTVRAWAYNRQVPGPELRVREGDTVRVTLVNKLPVGTTIHWHGLNVPAAMDGPAGLNQAPVESGQSFTYEFTATPAGTRWYHSHTDVATQTMLGLYGAFVVEPKDGDLDKADRDYTYILSEWDDEMTPAVATGQAPRGSRDTGLRGGELGTDLFLMNGKTHEAIPPILVSEGDAVRIRLINAGTKAHPFHTHGHSFRIVATDGNPIPPVAQWTKDTIMIAPGERYDLVFDANNPGVWMVHCHIENHAAGGMMTVIQYEGALPTGPLAEIWNPTTTTGNSMGDMGEMGEMGDMSGMSTMHSASAHQSQTDTATPQPDPVTPAASTSQAATSDGLTAQIVMVDDRFQPTSLTIDVGTTVTWVNNGGDVHSVASLDGSFASAQVHPGESFAHTFPTPGTFKFLCKHHARQGMIGTIIVT